MSLITISGASGAGKSTLLYSLFEVSSKPCLVPSWTTRKPRENEPSHDIYEYIMMNDYRVKEKNMDFLLSEFIAGNYYGTSEDDIRGSIQSSQNWFSDLTAQSVIDLIRKKYPPTLCLILDIDPVVSKKRMEARGDLKNHVKDRMLRYEDEMRNCDILKSIHKNTFTINGNLSRSEIFKRALSIIREHNY